jgi:thioredoxin-related protein
LSGNPVSLKDFHSHRVLVVFWSPDCAFCEQMLNELVALESQPPAHLLRLVIISRGSEEANRALGIRSPVLIDNDFRAGAAFGVTGTPSAVLIDEDGNIASEVAAGAPRILALAGVRSSG